MFARSAFLARICAAPFALLALAPGALAQSFNIEFGNGLGAPSDEYPAAGLPGRWNTFAVLPSGQRRPLVALDAGATNARIYNIGGSSLLAHDNPATSGDDEKLLDEMLLSFNNPVDACIFFEGLQNGRYEVLMYAITPNDPTRTCSTRVDNAATGPTLIGGAWPGFHARGTSFSRHYVTVTNGTAGTHSGVFGGNFQSGINAIQLRLLPACPRDLDDGSGRGNSDNAVTIDDLLYFLVQFDAGSSRADLDNGSNAGIRDDAVTIDDLLFFLRGFEQGC